MLHLATLAILAIAIAIVAARAERLRLHVRSLERLMLDACVPQEEDKPPWP